MPPSQKGSDLASGTPYLCHVLLENGRADVAVDLLLQKFYPSWLYSVTQGATTIPMRLVLGRKLLITITI